MGEVQEVAPLRHCRMGDSAVDNNSSVNEVWEVPLLAHRLGDPAASRRSKTTKEAPLRHCRAGYSTGDNNSSGDNNNNMGNEVGGAG